MERIDMVHKRLFAFLLALVSVLFAQPTTAGVPLTKPILHIESGRHGAVIEGLAVDSGGRWLATASHDKTLRVWNLSSGALMQTLRPPQGEGNEGKLYSVAISPDGARLAVAGWTGYEWDQDISVYIFERTTGRLLKRIGNHSEVVKSLSWSADGRHLAVGLFGTGIRVYRATDFSLLGQDRDYADRVHGLDFSRDGTLVASSWDGSLRLYQVSSAGLKRLLRVSTQGGKQPHGVAFSPDGKRIAVGFADSPSVNLLGARTLEFVAAPDTRALPADQSLGHVAWSVDGRRLYAGGTALNGDGWRIVRTWPNGGAGVPRDLAAATDTILHIRALPDGGIVYGTSNSAWGVFDAMGVRRRFVAAETADYRGRSDELRVSSDGLLVGFGYESFGRQAARFSVKDRSLQHGGEGVTLRAPRFEAASIALKDWSNSMAPTLAGQTLRLEPGEIARSFAIAADDQGFALGTEFMLRRYDRKGQLRWSVAAPGTVWSVNLSVDGRFVVAACGDGTIRWYRWSDGRELLAFFPHGDRQRWVLWTPSGYYDASPGGEELIGWHVNRGKDMAADFFPAARFRSRYHRPDVIARLLDTLDEGEALRLANLDGGRKADAVSIEMMLPPVVEILSPEDGSQVSTDSIRLRYRTRTPADAPALGLRVRVNGLAVTLPETRNLVVTATGAADGVREVTVPIPPRDSEILLFAENRNGISVPASLRLNWRGDVRAEEIYKPRLYVLAVGVTQYANPDYNLGLAAKDAADFTRVLQQQKGKLYADVQVRLLTDAGATKDDVLDGLEWLKREVTARDVGIVFIAGHGKNDESGRYYFLPHNADPQNLLRTGVKQTDIRDTLNGLAGKAVFFVDTCHAGNVLGTARTRGVGTDINAFVNELSSAENGVVVFAAATGRQLSQEDEAWGNGAFTKAVVEGLAGRADFQKTGRITHKGLDYYVAERVKQLTKGTQSPVSIAPAGVSDFPLAIVDR